MFRKPKPFEKTQSNEHSSLYSSSVVPQRLPLPSLCYLVVISLVSVDISLFTLSVPASHFFPSPASPLINFRRVLALHPPPLPPRPVAAPPLQSLSSCPPRDADVLVRASGLAPVAAGRRQPLSCVFRPTSTINWCIAGLHLPVPSFPPLGPIYLPTYLFCLRYSSLYLSLSLSLYIIGQMEMPADCNRHPLSVCRDGFACGMRRGCCKMYVNPRRRRALSVPSAR